jgi:hypothetical protein
VGRILMFLGIAAVLAAGGWGGIVYFNKKDTKPVSAAKTATTKTAKKKRSFNKERFVALAKQQTDPANFSSFDPENSYEEGEMVVVDPPKGFSNSVGSLGFAITETVSLGDLGITVVRLRVPSGQTVRSARRVLLGRYPGLVVDANHQFDPSAERRRRVGSGSASDQLKKRRSSATNSRARSYWLEKCTGDLRPWCSIGHD